MLSESPKHSPGTAELLQNPGRSAPVHSNTFIDWLVLGQRNNCRAVGAQLR